MDPEDEICYFDPTLCPTEENLLDYFRNSPFYDKSCNNELLRMQILYTGNSQLQTQLDQMVGIEYRSSNNLIEKINRTSNSTTLLDVYYLVNNVVFKAPTDKKIFMSRIINAMSLLSRALTVFSSNLELFEKVYNENDDELKEIVKIISDYGFREK